MAITNRQKKLLRNVASTGTEVSPAEYEQATEALDESSDETLRKVGKAFMDDCRTLGSDAARKKWIES